MKEWIQRFLGLEDRIAALEAWRSANQTLPIQDQLISARKRIEQLEAEKAELMDLLRKRVSPPVQHQSATTRMAEYVRQHRIVVDENGNDSISSV